MINVSSAFRTALNNDQRDYLLYADVTLKNGTILDTIQNADLWSGGFSVNDAVSSDNNFDIGAAIINGGKLILNNIYPLTQSSGKFSSYDFTDARVVLYVGLNINGTPERVRKGTYIVDDAKYNGSLITLSLLDNMSKFDRPYSESTLVYPATLGEIVRDACTHCNVTLNTYSFPHHDHEISAKPNSDTLTYREMISYVAQISGCFARCNAYGYLELKWFPASFTGNNVHRISSTFSHNLGVDEVVITGVTVTERVTVTETSTDSHGTTVTSTKEVTQSYTSGNNGYVIVVDGNPLVQDGYGQTIANWLGTQINGLRFRHGEISHLSDPTMEAGDVGQMTDPRGNTYNILISSTVFTAGNAQSTRSSAQTPDRNSATRYSAAAKTYTELMEKLHQEKKARNLALDELANRLAESPGLYTTVEVQEDNSKIYYLHDKPTLAESGIVWKMTAEAWGVTTNYDGANTVWNGGMTVDGDTIVRILSAVGINFDWAHGGTITLGGQNNGNGKLELYDATGNLIGYMDNRGLSASGNLEIYNGIKYAKFKNVRISYTELYGTNVKTINPIAFVIGTDDLDGLFALIPGGIGPASDYNFTKDGVGVYRHVNYPGDYDDNGQGYLLQVNNVDEIIDAESTNGAKYHHYRFYRRDYSHIVRKVGSDGVDSFTDATFDLGFDFNGRPYAGLFIRDMNNQSNNSSFRVSTDGVNLRGPNLYFNGVDIMKKIADLEDSVLALENSISNLEGSIS